MIEQIRKYVFHIAVNMNTYHKIGWFELLCVDQTNNWQEICLTVHNKVHFHTHTYQY